MSEENSQSEQICVLVLYRTLRYSHMACAHFDLARAIFTDVMCVEVPGGEVYKVDDIVSELKTSLKYLAAIIETALDFHLDDEDVDSPVKYSEELEKLGKDLVSGGMAEPHALGEVVNNFRKEDGFHQNIELIQRCVHDVRRRTSFVVEKVTELKEDVCRSTLIQALKDPFEEFSRLGVAWQRFREIRDALNTLVWENHYMSSQHKPFTNITPEKLSAA